MDIAADIAEFPEDLGEDEGGLDDSEERENEIEVTRAMVAMQNKKKRKSGGFQSMGKKYL